MKNINHNINIKTLIQQGNNIKQTSSMTNSYDATELEKLICSSLTFLDSEDLNDTIQYNELMVLLDNFDNNETCYKRVMGALLSCEQMYF